MANTRTLLVDIGKLQRLEKESAIVLRLMMACNDITTCNQALGACRADPCEKTDYIRRGAGMYFLRLQLAHLNEAFKAVSDISRHPKLQTMVDRCPRATADQLADLLSFADGGARRKEFQRYVESVRHKVTFHYDQGKVQAALRDRARRRGETAHFVTFSDDIRRIRFQVADDVIDTLVCRKLWGITQETDIRISADRIADFSFKICTALLDFASVFIARYIEANALFTR